MVIDIIKLNFDDFKEIYNNYIVKRRKPTEDHINKVLYAFNDAGLIISLEVRENIIIGIFKTEDEVYDYYEHNTQLKLV